MRFTLNELSKKSIEKSTGINVEDISIMDADSIDESIENKIGSKLEIQTKNGYLVSRGSVYLFLKRLVGIDVIDKKLSKI